MHFGRNEDFINSFWITDLYKHVIPTISTNLTKSIISLSVIITFDNFFWVETKKIYISKDTFFELVSSVFSKTTKLNEFNIQENCQASCLTSENQVHFGNFGNVHILFRGAIGGKTGKTMALPGLLGFCHAMLLGSYLAWAWAPCRWRPCSWYPIFKKVSESKFVKKHKR